MELDVLQNKLYALKVENRRLRDECPEQAEPVDLKDELKQTQKNVRLSQQVIKFCTDQGSDIASRTFTPEEVGRLQEELAKSGEETAELQQQYVEQAEKLEAERKRCNKQQRRLNEERQERKRWRPCN